MLLALEFNLDYANQKPLLLSVIGQQQQGFLRFGEKEDRMQRTQFFRRDQSSVWWIVIARNFIVGCIVSQDPGC